MKMTGKILSAAVMGAAVAFAGPALAQKTSVTLGMVLEPPNLDPTAGAAAAIDEVVYANVFEGLTRYAEDGSIQPALAESWDISEDELSYTFHLHEGVTFHDGTEMTAEDVKFSLDRARAEDSTNAQKVLFEDIESVEVVDPHTVQVNLSQPDGAFLSNMAWGDAVIVAEESAADNATNPVGTGPFQFEDWREGDSVELTRYEDYWGEPVALESAIFKFIDDPTAAFSAMMAGDLDAYPSFPAPENIAQFEADPQFKVIEGSTEGEIIMAMNNAVEPFDDIRVRKAVAHAIDREGLIEGAYFGYGTPIGSHLAPQNPAYVDLTGQSAYDPELSRELLAEAGYEDGFETTLKLPPPSYARRGGEILASYLRDVGIEAEIINVEWAQWLQSVFEDTDYHLTVVAHTEPMDINIYARDDYYFNYDSEEFREIMAELEATADEEARNELLEQAQRKLADDYVNAFLFQLPKLGVAKADLMGLWQDQPTQANDLTGVYWKE